MEPSKPPVLVAISYVKASWRARRTHAGASSGPRYCNAHKQGQHAFDGLQPCLLCIARFIMGQMCGVSSVPRAARSERELRSHSAGPRAGLQANTYKCNTETTCAHQRTGRCPGPTPYASNGTADEARCALMTAVDSQLERLSTSRYFSSLAPAGLTKISGDARPAGPGSANEVEMEHLA